MRCQLNHLDNLEHEAIYIIREALSQFSRIALLFSGGKDSTVLFHLLRKAIYPAKSGVFLLHIDTGHNFPETLEFRDKIAKKHEFKIIIKQVEDSIKQGKTAETAGDIPSRNSCLSITLLNAIEELKIDACLCGARRDEEKARAKERIFSLRNSFGEWNPKKQRPEFWNLFNGRKATDEHFRIFPLSNWTEEDIWLYIKKENIELPSLYFSHEREVFKHQGNIYAMSQFIQFLQKPPTEILNIRYRTVGDMTCTSAFESPAKSISEIIKEIQNSKVSERSSRIDDKGSDTAMEDRKKVGYF